MSAAASTFVEDVVGANAAAVSGSAAPKKASKGKSAGGSKKKAPTAEASKKAPASKSKKGQSGTAAPKHALNKAASEAVREDLRLLTDFVELYKFNCAAVKQALTSNNGVYVMLRACFKMLLDAMSIQRKQFKQMGVMRTLPALCTQVAVGVGGFQVPDSEFIRQMFSEWLETSAPELAPYASMLEIKWEPLHSLTGSGGRFMPPMPFLVWSTGSVEDGTYRQLQTELAAEDEEADLPLSTKELVEREERRRAEEEAGLPVGAEAAEDAEDAGLGGEAGAAAAAGEEGEEEEEEDAIDEEEGSGGEEEGGEEVEEGGEEVEAEEAEEEAPAATPVASKPKTKAGVKRARK